MLDAQQGDGRLEVVQRVEALAMVHLPTPKNLAVRVAGTYAVNGRNVGQATTFTAGLLYTFHF